MQSAPLEQFAPLTRHAAGNVTVYLNPDYHAKVRLDDLLHLPAILQKEAGRSSRLAGKITLWHWRPTWQSEPGLVVRRYAHGGLCGRVAGTLFLSARRMLDEFRLSIYARTCGVPTCRPVALRIERVFGPLITGHYVTDSIPDASNILDFLAAAPNAQNLKAEQRRRLAASIASTIASMHDAGILHADLNLKNLLVRDAFDEPEVFVIDFDKAKLIGSPTLRQRMANMVRLDRSVTKWAASRRLVGTMDRLRVLRSYLGRYPQWTSRWRQIGRKYASRHLLHYFSRQRD